MDFSSSLNFFNDNNMKFFHQRRGRRIEFPEQPGIQKENFMMKILQVTF